MYLPPVLQVLSKTKYDTERSAAAGDSMSMRITSLKLHMKWPRSLASLCKLLPCSAFVVTVDSLCELAPHVIAWYTHCIDHDSLTDKIQRCDLLTTASINEVRP